MVYSGEQWGNVGGSLRHMEIEFQCNEWSQIVLVNYDRGVLSTGIRGYGGKSFEGTSVCCFSLLKVLTSM